MKCIPVVAFLVSASVFAAPGGNAKPQPAQGPLMMVNSSGKELGPAIPLDDVGTNVGTFVRYGGETFGVLFLESPPANSRYFEPNRGTVYFSSPDCAGGATYVDLGTPGVSINFTPRAAVVVYTTAEGDGSPGPRYLFATAPHNRDEGMVQSYGSALSNGVCRQGGTSPGLTPATFVVDLTAAFPPPYEVR